MAIYNKAKKKLLDGTIDLSTSGDTIKAALLTDAYTVNLDTHEFFSDVSGSQASASVSGYTPGGQDLASKTTVVDTVNDRVDFDAADVVWTITGSLTARNVVLYKDTGVAGTSPLIAVINFGSNQTSTDGDFTIQWNVGGIIRLS